MDPKDIAKRITDDPDVFNESWEELGIEDPRIEGLPPMEDPIEVALEKAGILCHEMLNNKADTPHYTKDKIFVRIMAQLKELLDSGQIHYKDWRGIEEFLSNEIETAIWNPPDDIT